MDRTWVETVPVLEQFEHVTDASRYVAVPGDWSIGVCDVVNSTDAIQSGGYKSVNLAGAGAISAVANALSGDLELFVFGGDGARFAVPPSAAATAAEALSRAAMWVGRDLDLDLRVGMMPVAAIREAGHDVRVAFFKASEHVNYAMFMGGGLEWAEQRLKDGALSLPAAQPDEEPDLTGLSCQWGPIQPTRGKIVSLIVKHSDRVSEARFGEVTASVVATLEGAAALNPVPEDGPQVRWPGAALGLQSSIARKGRSGVQSYIATLATAGFAWLVFKLGLRLGSFDANAYRREIAANTDFRKFDDALMMTVDCAPETIEKLRELLDSAQSEGAVRYGLHIQDEALMTCVVPSIAKSNHFHFIDGAGGGYTTAAKQLRD